MDVQFAAHNLKLLGSGIALPGAPVCNDTLIAALDARCNRGAGRRARIIAHRLGITKRHVSRNLNAALSGTTQNNQAPQLCGVALLRALDEAGISLRSVSYLIGHTSTPHTLLPPNIAWVADELEYTGPYMELRQACTGFANGLQIASAMVSANRYDALAIVGSETGSPYFNISDDFLDNEQLVNYMQMGDGAGAVVLGQDDGSPRHKISEIFTGQIGVGKDPGICIEGGGSADPRTVHGLPVFQHRAENVKKFGRELFIRGVEAITARGYRLDEFDWILPHQANGRLAKQFSDHFKVAVEKIFVTADRLGNLGSAAIWVALDQLRRSELIERGHRVLVLGAEATKYLYGGFIYQH